MRPLTSNEKFLLSLLALIAFVGINFFGYRALRKGEGDQTLAYTQLRADQAEARVALRDAQLWTQRENWVAAHEPVVSNEGDAKAQTLQAVLSGARGHALEIQEQELNDSGQQGGGFQVQITLTVKGSMQALAEWISALQDPAGFYAVPYISLKTDADQKAMVCTLHISRFFQRAKT